MTYGGFDWMTATVGGLWDSLLAEGTPWWITANSDAHGVYLDTAVRGPDSDFAANGRYDDPVHGRRGRTPRPATSGPGTTAARTSARREFSYAAVMQGLRAGRVWVDHGRLLDNLDVRVRYAGDVGGATLGVRRHVRARPPGDAVDHAPDRRPCRTGRSSSRCSRTSTSSAARSTGPVGGQGRDHGAGHEGREDLRRHRAHRRDRAVVRPRGADAPFYVRLRGSDGKQLGPGLNGAAVDPAGPRVDVLGNADPWDDLWFYTNPIWVLPSA